MGKHREPRLVVNPGFVCQMLGKQGDKAQAAVVNISRSGIALCAIDDDLPEGEAFELSLHHSCREASDNLGSQKPLRARARARRREGRRRRMGLQFDDPLAEDVLAEIRQIDHLVFPTGAARWNADAFLDQLALAGDFAADALDAKLTFSRFGATNAILDGLDGRGPGDGATPLPDLSAFLNATSPLPAGTDSVRLERGRVVFLDHLPEIGLVLFLKVLPTGYCVPALTRALSVSGDSKDRPVRRSVLVLQMLLDMCKDGSFERPYSGARLGAQKLRLFHAGVRRIVLSYISDYEERFGKPVSQEQVLATLAGFSYQTLEGMRQLGAGLSSQQEQDYYYLWQIYGRLLGLHPEGMPDSTRHMPQDFEELAAFQAAFRRRHFKSLAENPDGAVLTQSLLDELGERLHSVAPLPFVRGLPGALTRQLMAPEDLERVGIQRSVSGELAAVPILSALALVLGVKRRLPGVLCSKLTHRLVLGGLSRMVTGELGKLPTVRVPGNVSSLRNLVETEAAARAAE